MSRNGSLLATEPTDRRSDRSKKQMWIYFHKITTHEPPPVRITIGKSTQSRGQRLAQHRNSRHALSIDAEELCEVKGKDADESALHRYFSDFKVNGKADVFYPDDKLVDYIRWLRDQHFVSVPELKDEYRDAVEQMDFSAWMPDATRTKPSRRKTEGYLPGIDGDLDLPPRETTGDDYYTSERIVSCARRVMGGIDLDPASHVVANQKVKATRFYTIGDNGLNRKWSGRVWLNPPFSAWSDWVPKLLHELKEGHVSQVCCLAATRTFTAQYFSPLLMSCNAMCIMFGRIPFWGPIAKPSPDDGHGIFYFGQNREAFKTEFDTLGTTFFSSR